MQPDGTNVEAYVLDMKDEEGNAILACPHPGQIFYVLLEHTPQAYDILRFHPETR